MYDLKRPNLFNETIQTKNNEQVSTCKNIISGIFESQYIAVESVNDLEGISNPPHDISF